MSGLRTAPRPVRRADSTDGCNTLDAIEAEGVLQMKQRPRIYYSANQRALIWDRWQKGETLHQIARLFDRYHSSIQGMVAETGGIRPAERRRSRWALTLTEREEITRGREVRSGRSRGRSGEHRLRSAARYDAMVAREDIGPVEPTRRLGIGPVARRPVNWCSTRCWHAS
jgi:hypothetical protein